MKITEINIDEKQAAFRDIQRKKSIYSQYMYIEKHNGQKNR